MIIKRKIVKQGNSFVLIPEFENYFENTDPGEFYALLEWENID